MPSSSSAHPHPTPFFRDWDGVLAVCRGPHPNCWLTSGRQERKHSEMGGGLLSPPKAFPVKEAFGECWSLSTALFVPSVLWFAGNTAGGFPGDAFLEKRRAEPGQEPSRSPETVPGSVASAGLSVLHPAPWQLVPERWREVSAMLRCPRLCCPETPPGCGEEAWLWPRAA